MTKRETFASSALTRAVQGELGARRPTITRETDTSLSQESSTVDQHAIVSDNSMTVEHNATRQRYHLPLPKPRQKAEERSHASIYLPKGLMVWFRSYCQQNDVSMNQVVVEYVEELRRQSS